MPQPALSVVVPAYNEAAGIVPTLEAIGARIDALDRAMGAARGRQREHRRDGGRAESAGRPRVRVLRNDANRGKGFSVRRGMLAARGDLRLHCDADCGASLASLPALLEAIEAADVAVGSRLATGSRGRAPPAAAPPDRRAHLRAPVPPRPQRADPRPVLRLQALARPAAEAVFRRTRIDGWAFDAEALALARALGLTIAEVGIAWATGGARGCR